MGCQCSQNADDQGNEVVALDRKATTKTLETPTIREGTIIGDSARTKSPIKTPPVSKYDCCFLCHKPDGQVVQVSRSLNYSGKRNISKLGTLAGGGGWTGV